MNQAKSRSDETSTAPLPIVLSLVVGEFISIVLLWVYKSRRRGVGREIWRGKRRGG